MKRLSGRVAVVTAGREIEDIRLVFRDGKAVEATAARNEDYLVQTLDTDPGADDTMPSPWLPD